MKLSEACLSAWEIYVSHFDYRSGPLMLIEACLSLGDPRKPFLLQWRFYEINLGLFEITAIMAVT